MEIAGEKVREGTNSIVYEYTFVLCKVRNRFNAKAQAVYSGRRVLSHDEN